MEKIKDGIYAGMKFRGCNSGLIVTPEGIVMIDTPMVPSEAKQWLADIKKMGELKYVINNEPHNDHVAGNCWLGATLIAHEDTREAIKHNQKAVLEGQMSWMAPDALPLPPEWHYRLPDITFKDEMTIYLGRLTIKIISVPGHTASETAVYVPEAKTVFVSDNVMPAGMPIFINAVPDAWLLSLKKLQKLDVDTVIPGHGPVCKQDVFQIVYDNVKYVTEKTREAIAEGWSLPDIKEKLTFFERFPAVPGDPMKQMRHESLEGLYHALKM
jgi:glyoxylase-like metal-dependent hydrolase (beta-lactamase superfamily II)